jgi:ATP-dependent RNA helicase HelY
VGLAPEPGLGVVGEQHADQLGGRDHDDALHERARHDRARHDRARRDVDTLSRGTRVIAPAGVLRATFEAERGFSLDPFQVAALDALDVGESVLVAAPTGSGKTVVADYAVACALAAGGKVFYTTPLKALSNQKYGDLARAHGTDRVGLLTGDNSINGDAPVVVMTTEVLRNMIYAASATLEGLRYVVLDEVHYLQDRYRGPVWEEVIVHLPSDVRLVCLSATVSNAEEVAAWIETVRGATAAVIEEHRPVTLEHRYVVGERGSDLLHLMPTFVAGPDAELRPNPDAARLDARNARDPGWRGRPRTRLRTPSRVETVELLASESMLPAIAFIFSRKGCDQAVQQCLAAGLRLTDPAERAQIRAVADAKTESLADADLDVLRYHEWLAGLEAGFAAHHAGMVPPMKEAVEEAFSLGLAKVVFATETLALGINMPARSVVIEKLSKFTGERHEFLTPGEYTQLTGRAGRRGIDARGYAVVCWSPFVPFDQVAALASRRSDALTSSFRPTYNMAANLVRRYSKFEAHHLLNLSFAQFHADRDVVSLERQLDRSRQNLARQREVAGAELADIQDYRRLAAELDALRREQGGTNRRFAEAMEALRPGDVVFARRRGGRVVVLNHEHRRGGGTRVVALTAGQDVVRLGIDDFDGPPRRAATIELPQPFAPRTPSFRKHAAERLRRVKVHDDRAASRRADRRRGQLETELEAHPLTRDPARESKLRAAAAIERLERDVTRTERRVRGRSASLARQFDRVLRVLEAWGYVEGWALTDIGERLSRLYTETDLLLAEAMRERLLDGLTPGELAAVISCFTYERRGPDGEQAMPPARWPTKTVAKRARAIERISADLRANEDDAGLPETRSPDPGFTPYVYDWVAGDSLADVLDDDEMTGGDFVRHVKQCIDLLRQIGDVAPDHVTRARAREAADACHRGVVAASSVVAT